MRRLIIAPQLPIKMRYQQWWPAEFANNLADIFDSVLFVGRAVPVAPDSLQVFSHLKLSVLNECEQIKEIMALRPTPNDTLLHCDLSYPGIFHGVLPHLECQKIVMCHATSLNRWDIFREIRETKWEMEKAAAANYDIVLVATKYHYHKLSLPNAMVMGGLPNPPSWTQPDKDEVKRNITFTCVSRPNIQKVRTKVEEALTKLTKIKIDRPNCHTWKGYYSYLDRCKYMVITSKEETYGYQVVDALLRGCIPIAPYAFSYPELLPREFLYDNRGTAKAVAKRIWKITQNKPAVPELICQGHVDNFWDNLKEVLLGGQLN